MMENLASTLRDQKLESPEDIQLALAPNYLLNRFNLVLGAQARQLLWNS